MKVCLHTLSENSTPGGHDAVQASRRTCDGPVPGAGSSAASGATGVAPLMDREVPELLLPLWTAMVT